MHYLKRFSLIWGSLLFVQNGKSSHSLETHLFKNIHISLKEFVVNNP